MFSYSCEKCGMEVPPAYSECPNCAANAAQAAAAATGVPTEPSVTPPASAQPQQVPPQTAPPAYYTPAGVPPGAQPAAVPQAAQPPQMPPTVVGPPPPAQQPMPYYAQPPQPRRGAPAWLVTGLVAIVMVLAGYVGYTQVLPKYRESQAATSFEAPGTAAETPAAGAPHKLNKYLEITGVRIIEENRKPVVKLTVVNHSAAELTDISGVVEILTTADKSSSKPLGQVPLKLSSIGAYESKDVSLPFATTLRAYEMPDWQFVRAVFKEAGR